MSNPCSTDVGLLVQSLNSGARVRVLDDGEPYLASWFDETQGHLCPKT
ncbi:hypothetical protein SAMN05444050_5889 [Afipia sp. GAS231]|nr:hypothetical protein SAMN05444050_5889 [Afipia sp. GAS231]